jgi:hypothetical protein
MLYKISKRPSVKHKMQVLQENPIAAILLEHSLPKVGWAAALVLAHNNL